MKFQDYWDKQINRLKNTWCDSQMNYLFDECKKSYEMGFQFCKYLKDQCDCEKCKTEWKDIPHGMEIGTEYWLLDASKRKGRGIKREHTISLYFSQCDEDFGIAVMYAEIKPPEVPK